jgi:glycosyltransferase involved in cell wall biosynthesis
MEKHYKEYYNPRYYFVSFPLILYYCAYKLDSLNFFYYKLIRNSKVVVVLPAYNAEKTLESTYREIPFDIVDEVILVDDASKDHTVRVAKHLGIRVIEHEKNLDYQYTPKLISAMACLLESAEFDVVLGSRILGGKAMSGGMPLYKYISNRILTLIQNILMGAKLSEYHTGYRAFTSKVLESLPLDKNSNDFVFDNEMLSQILYAGFRIGEISCPAKYFADASSINFLRSLKYGLGCLRTSLQFRLSRMGLLQSPIFTFKL